MTASPGLPDELRRFILTRVPSVPYLEAMLLFHRTPGVRRTAADVAHALYLPERSVAGLLRGLCEAGVLAMDPDQRYYRYEPRDERLAHTIDQLALHYAADLIGISALIHDAGQKSAQQFADAFRLRKE